MINASQQLTSLATYFIAIKNGSVCKAWRSVWILVMRCKVNLIIWRDGGVECMEWEWSTTCDHDLRCEMMSKYSDFFSGFSLSHFCCLDYDNSVQGCCDVLREYGYGIVLRIVCIYLLFFAKWKANWNRRDESVSEIA